ncbi:MAG: prephenate dehydrogenase, partial [Pseudonocardiales bacterium]
WVAFTSANAVQALFAHLADARALGETQVAAVGTATATALASHGVVADLVAGRAVAEALADTALTTGPDPGTSPGAGAGGGPDLKVLAALLEQGGAGVARIPGKRGAPARAEAAVQVVIPDRPGELARLFQAAGEAGVNIEDIGIEHSPGLPVGVAELTVHPEAVGRLTEALAANGWPVRR